MILPKKCTIKTDNHFVIKRDIPGSLDILIEKGETVRRDSIIASGNVFEQKARVDISEQFDIDSSVVKRHVLFIHGERVRKGDIIFKYRRKKDKVFQAPCNGVLSLSDVNSGIITILGVSRETNINAGVKGKIVRVIPHKQIHIEGKVLRIKPFVLYGQSIQGELFYIDDNEHILDPSLSGGIVVISYNTFLTHFRSFQALGIRGVIVSGTDATLFQKIEQSIGQNISICLLEGFGKRYITHKLSGILKENDGHICLFDAKNNELVLTHTQKDEKFRITKSVVYRAKKGQGVQIFQSDAWGMYGSIVSLKNDQAVVLIKENEIEKKIKVHINNIIIPQ